MPPKKEKKPEDIISELAALDAATPIKFYGKISLILYVAVSDDQFGKICNLIGQKIDDQRFDLFLKISTRINRNKIASNPKLLVSRLCLHIKTEVRQALGALDPDITQALDLINENTQFVKDWLLRSNKREEFVRRAKLCYIYISLKFNRLQTADFEQILLSAMETDKNISFSKHTGKLFPEVLLSKSPFNQVEKMAYFHYRDAEKAEELGTKLNEMQSKFESVRERNIQLNSENHALNTQINKLTKELEERSERVAALQVDIKAAEDKLEYESDKYAQETTGFKSVYASKLNKRLSVEFVDMTAILSHVEEPEKSRLLRLISNVQEILSE